MSELNFESIAALANLLRDGELTSVELTEAFLARIDTLDGKLNGFLRLCPERALDEARAADAALRGGRDTGPLLGVPFAAKDLFDVQGLPTTAGCSLLDDNIAQADSAAVRRLAEAGMVLLGKTNTVQFAYGGVGINHDHGTPHNPWRETHHVPGGSSSGSGVAVASGMAPMALGSDTGGSVRIPAALCGVTGLKTTVGQISRAGVYPLSSSLDSVGPLCRTVEDAALVYQCLQGPDSADNSTSGRGFQDVITRLRKGIRGLRVAFAETVFWDDADPEVVSIVRNCGEIFKELGAQVSSVEFSEAEEARQLNPGGLVIAAEAYSVNRHWVEEHFEGMDPAISNRVIKGKDISAADYIDTTRAWDELRQRADHTLSDFDVVLCPASMNPARPIAEVDTDNEAYTDNNLAYLRNTSIGNILNLCGLSVPCGFTNKGLPVGLMIYGRSFHEDTVLRAGYAFQQATMFHQSFPDLSWLE